jgi:hypothetical protein
VEVVRILFVATQNPFAPGGSAKRMGVQLKALASVGEVRVVVVTNDPARSNHDRFATSWVDHPPPCLWAWIVAKVLLVLGLCPHNVNPMVMRSVQRLVAQKSVGRPDVIW